MAPAPAVSGSGLAALVVAVGLALAACGPSHGLGEGLATGGGPTTAELMDAGALGDISFGRDDAPVTIVEYASLTCPHCRQFHRTTFPRLKQEMIDTGRVRYVIREFPIGRTAGAAAIVNRCAGQARYLDLYGRFLEQQGDWVAQEVRHDAIYKVASQVGMSRSEFDNCLANQMIIDGLVWVKDRGRKFGVVGTPTFFVNGEKASGVLTFEQLKAMIEPRAS